MTPSAPHPRRLVVTGARGFIGRALVARARAAGHQVLALSRTDGSVASYEDADLLAQACTGADAIVHLAARAHRGGMDADFDVNVRATHAIAQAAVRAGVPRLVLVSSIGVNGNVTRGKPFDENDPPAPVEPYARSKLRCEQELRATLDGSATRWTIVRPPLVYGPNAPGNFGRLVRAVRRGLPMPLASVRNRRSLLGVDPLADALLLCAIDPRAADKLFLLADAEDLSSAEIIRCIARGLDQPARLWRVPPTLLKAAARLAGRARLAESLCDSLQVDASKARRTLDWHPELHPADAIARAVAAWSRA